MPEVVKNPAMMIIAFAVFLLLIIIIAEIFYRVKMGRALCNFFGGMLVQVTGYSGILSGPTKVGIEATCNLFPF